MSEIIIDGVDVSECSYYSSETYPYTCEVWDNECEAQNCYYKQLQRAKAEIERLKEENNELCKRMAEVTYRATGGRLSYPNYTLDAIEQAFYDQLEILSDQKSEKYKQALQEIRDIADRTDGNHPASVINMVSVIRHTINSVIGAEE